MPILSGSVSLRDLPRYHAWLNHLVADSDEGGLGLGALGYTARPITSGDARRPFENSRVSWTLADFAEEARLPAKDSLILEVGGQVALVLTLEFPATCRCRTPANCLKLYMLARNERAPNDHVARLVVMALDRLVRALGLSCLELDALAALHGTGYYQEFGYVDCGPEFVNEDNERVVPMRKVPP